MDDYVDRDKIPNAWQKLGRDVGTSVALALIAEALTTVIGPDELTDIALGKAAGVLASHLKDASLGQARDAAGISSLEGYEQMLELKAASLIAALTEVIAVIAESKSDLRQAMRNFGWELGIAIQIINDYLGIWYPDKVAKDSGGDLNEQKLTYPILYAMNVDHSLSGEFRRLMEDAPGKRNCDRMLEILNELGAPEFMLSAIYVRRERALHQLEGWASQEDLAQLEQWCDKHLLGKT
jgi:geranylgeranyl pyrophosphate synthase